ncbi:hypothetical protein Pyn_38700 [Prunus yedoensis var. nudiflora]|uniref:Uncharacterized protein n=1 Tax=Prunus yedoensis var. nudiflora TaxID=2094558 RepID=A0A314Z6E8_PRUYE|nr:hypothetical protein Pyn_38700 [Prunus yedoensis var. nudiflora]
MKKSQHKRLGPTATPSNLHPPIGAKNIFTPPRRCKGGVKVTLHPRIYIPPLWMLLEAIEFKWTA